jgi:hypothetical protein
MLVGLATIVALTVGACNTDDTSSGGTSGGGGTVTVVAAPKLSVVHSNCYADEKDHRFQIKASGLSPHFRYDLYLYRASADTTNPKNAFLTLSGRADGAGKVSQSFSCKNKVYRDGADAMILEESSSLRKSNKAFLDVLRTN